MSTVPMYRYLKMLRITACYSKEEVAGWLSITTSAYGHYETGRYNGMNRQYLSILEKRYHLTRFVLSQLPLVDNPQLLPGAFPLSPAENLAAFLFFFNDPYRSLTYKNLSYDEKWCIYYCSLCKNKEALLCMLSAAPEISAFLFS